MIEQADAEFEESQRRSVLLRVMARAMTNAVKSKKQQKDLQRNLDALEEDTRTIPIGEDVDNDADVKKEPLQIYPPKQNSFIYDVLQPQADKIELNLYGQYLKATEEIPVGTIRKPAPSFITKLI